MSEGRASGRAGAADGDRDSQGAQHAPGARLAGRLLLGAFLVLAGTAHLTVARTEFRAQVPPWVPLDVDLVVVLSGVVELAAGAAVLLAPSRWRPWVGWGVAALFVAVFPGNVAQLTEGRDAFGLDTDLARAVRLLFQPLLVLWALWALGAWPRPRSGRGPEPFKPFDRTV